MKKLSLLVIALAVAALGATVDPRPAHADDLYQERPTLDTSDGSGGPAPCGFGSTIECGSVTYDTCVEWKEQTSITFGPMGITFTTSYVCSRRITTNIKKYKD